MTANESADVLFPPEVTLTTRSLQRQIVHGQHDHLSHRRHQDHHHKSRGCRMNRVFVTCCQVSLIRSKPSLPSSEQSQQMNLKKLSPLR